MVLILRDGPLFFDGEGGGGGGVEGGWKIVK